MFELIL